MLVLGGRIMWFRVQKVPGFEAVALVLPEGILEQGA